jgi:DNA-binding CsgD family transcriptional regulator
MAAGALCGARGVARALYRRACPGLHRARHLGGPAADAAPGPTGPFARNEAAIRALGLTPRECEILDLLASGRSNKELARSLGISPNTVKTHVARLYEKLGVDRRIRAVEEARALALIPRGDHSLG